MKIEEDQIDSSHDRAVKILETNLLEHLKLKCNDSNVANDELTSICHQVWLKFSNVHQKSPSHKNNNVQNCSNTKKKERRAEYVDTCHKEHKVNPQIIPGYQNILNHHWISSVHSIISFFLIVLKFIFYSTLISIILYCMIVLHKPTQGFISRNTQDLIYPFMRSLRIFSLPFVERYPVIANLYEDPCLFSNPYFSMGDIDCWPCDTVRNIVDLTGVTNLTPYHEGGIPFIVTEAFESDIGIEDIHSIFSQHGDLMTKVDVHPNLNGISTLQDLLETQSSSLLDEEKLHVQWTISRVSTVRFLRRYFPKPYFIPNGTEVSVQHFLFMDQYGSKSYSLPLTEFANVFVMQASGTRSIVLIPTKWCQQRCKVVSTILQPRDVFVYNWLYWRPMSVAVESSNSNLSVTYVGSFY